MFEERLLFWMNKLNSVPRPSGHEKAVSDLLVKELTRLGFLVEQDCFYNIKAEVPASKGYENVPLVILQGHMDMVVAVKEGIAFDALCDAPSLELKDGILSSGGITSIGADDGIGIAMAIAIAESDLPHGPLRLLFTADEEDGMSGAQNVDTAWLDATYLVNLDWEEFGSLCNSCAGCRGYEITDEPDYIEVTENEAAYVLSVSGLRGGHSGITIGENRENAILTVASCLQKLTHAGVSYRIATFCGGSARNAIPSSASATIVIPVKEQEAFELAFGDINKEFINEPSAAMTLSQTKLPLSAADNKNTQRLMGFLLAMPNGVYTMSQSVDNLVECSSNLGVIDCSALRWYMEPFARSSSEQKESELEQLYFDCASQFGFIIKVVQSAPGWPVNPQSKLVPKLQKCFFELFQKEIDVTPVHAGLECGWFSIKNRSLDCVSFGPTLKEVHTCNEALVMKTATDSMRLLAALLSQLL